MAVVEVRDREQIAAFCRRRPAVHAYALGDLDDFFWQHTRWYAWAPTGAIEQLVLVYSEPEPIVVHALAEEPVDTMRALLLEIADLLPTRIYAHVSPDALVAVTASRRPLEAPELHLKLGLEPDRMPRVISYPADVGILRPEDIAEVEAFYRAAYPGTWFHPRMLETHQYVGLREDGDLVSVAGVHVYSPRFGIAALGNVATHPSARGRGLGTAACGHLCRLLVANGISTISLNVRADNKAAISVYERLGFSQVAEYLEVSLGV